MLDQIINSPNFRYLPQGMAAASLRHEVISNNIANVNTPGFKRSTVKFEDLLANELQPEGDKSNTCLSLYRTNSKHLPLSGTFSRAVPTIEVDNSTNMRLDGNNVDIDVESTELAKNQLYHSALATQFGSFVSGLKEVINSQ